MQVVFQDPYGSLSPRMSVSDIIEEGLWVHHPKLAGEQREQRVIRALRDVGLDPETRFRYPHEFSGGQRQRIAVARAIVLEPTFVVLDEPTSALDMLIQAQIVDLLRALQKRHNLTYTFISHDLRVVAALACRLVVMRHGKVVEEGPAADLFARPKSDYTRALLAAAFNLEAVPVGVSHSRAPRLSRDPENARMPLADRAVDVAIAGSELLAKGFRDYRRYRFKLPGEDAALPPRIRDVLRAGRVAAVLPIYLERDEVVLLRQFRLSGHLANGHGELVEIVAGRVEGNEQPIETALRESVEEIGVSAEPAGRAVQLSADTGADRRGDHAGLGIVDAAQVPERGGAPAEREVTRPLRVPIDAALAEGSCGTAPWRTAR